MGDERGAVTAFVVTFTVALLGVAGLVGDGGFVLAAHRQAADEAEAAARAGAQAVDEGALRAAGTVALDPDAARARALDYLAATGHRGRVEVTGDTVWVEVSFERDLTLLRMFGLGPVTVTGDGEAHGVRGP
ncbi:MAG: pilus assembly protein TadG-related protein [Actinomycetota bacterium]